MLMPGSISRGARAEWSALGSSRPTPSSKLETRARSAAQPRRSSANCGCSAHSFSKATESPSPCCSTKSANRRSAGAKSRSAALSSPVCIDGGAARIARVRRRNLSAKPHRETSAAAMLGTIAQRLARYPRDGAEACLDGSGSRIRGRLDSLHLDHLDLGEARDRLEHAPEVLVGEEPRDPHALDLGT